MPLPGGLPGYQGQPLPLLAEQASPLPGSKSSLPPCLLPKGKKKARTKKKEGRGKAHPPLLQTPLSMVALASFPPVPNILFLGKTTKTLLRHTSLPETSNPDCWTPMWSGLRPGYARNHLGSTEDSLFAADEQRIHTEFPEYSYGFQHCQLQDTIVPYKEVKKSRKSEHGSNTVEEGIKEHQ